MGRPTWAAHGLALLAATGCAGAHWDALDLLPPLLRGEVDAPAAQAGGELRIAKQWMANATMTFVANGETLPGGPRDVQYFYDGARGRWRVLRNSQIPLFHPGDIFTMDILYVNQTSMSTNFTIGHGDDRVCHPTPLPYSDPFAAVEAAAARAGEAMVGGKPCDLWRATVPVQGEEQTVTICVGADGVPLEMNSTRVAGGRNGTDVTRWYNAVLGPPPAEALEPSEVCLHRYPTKECEDLGVVTLDVYRIHSPSEPYTLDDRNAGDALGDMAFTCAQGGAAGSPGGPGGGINGSIVSWWTVEVSRNFGQYAFCRFSRPLRRNICFGGDARRVGRESPLGLGVGRLQGQCSPNLDVGSWFSFPAAGRCADEQPIGANGCTWRNARRVRSIEADCIMKDRGLETTCKSEVGHAPLAKSATIFANALWYRQPADGGCPERGEIPSLLV
mmetsp:Transcript_88366/g.247194  ORF Transcript_88366/g.247194 Transcript_88366/m.247194 type:complete len:445 (-) Transcript_88366:44-1378(-)